MDAQRPVRIAMRGVTLVELLVVVSIAAILASLAYPSYTHYLQRSRRADALVALMQIQMAQEHWRAVHPGYAPNLQALKLGTLAAEQAGHYRLSMTLDDAGNYVATASATGAQAADAACASLSLSIRGGQAHRDATGTAPPDECWGMR